MKTLPALAAALLLASSASAAIAGGSYTGNWPVTVSKSQFTNGT
ncbi:MAG TPA: hypothetical protein VGF97_00515 [Rhizomicrobium sp.]|jgi:hypothetical protein